MLGVGYFSLCYRWETSSVTTYGTTYADIWLTDLSLYIAHIMVYLLYAMLRLGTWNLCSPWTSIGRDKQYQSNDKEGNFKWYCSGRLHGEGAIWTQIWRKWRSEPGSFLQESVPVWEQQIQGHKGIPVRHILRLRAGQVGWTWENVGGCSWCCQRHNKRADHVGLYGLL